VVDLSDTWVRVAIPETDADTLDWETRSGFVCPVARLRKQGLLQAAEADFATQRDVGRRKRDIRTIVLKCVSTIRRALYVPA